MSHIVETCLLTKLNGSLSRLYPADEDAVSWLIMVYDIHTRKKEQTVKDTSLHIRGKVYCICMPSCMLRGAKRGLRQKKIDHNTLIDRLRHTYGLTGTTLDWLRSYLSWRRSFVRWRSCSSDSVSVDTGVPQGSALGPQWFSVYIASLAGLIRSHGVRYHQYADDSQVYIAISRDDADAQLATLEHCVSEVHEWLLHNGLALNPAKSDAVQFSTGRGCSSVDNVAAITGP